MNTTGPVGWRSWYTDCHSNICNYLVSFRRSLLCVLQRTDLGVFLIVSFFNVLICPERSVALAWWPSPQLPKHQLPQWEGQMGWFLRCSAAPSLKDGGSQVFSLTQTLGARQQKGRMVLEQKLRAYVWSTSKCRERKRLRDGPTSEISKHHPSDTPPLRRSHLWILPKQFRQLGIKH